METIVFIETTKSGSSREAIKAVERLGFLTVLITERTSFMKQRMEFSDVAHMILVKEMTEQNIRFEIAQLQKQGKLIKAIVSFVDPFVSIAAQLMNEICESDISVESLKKMEDKTVTRKALKKNQTTPKFKIYRPTDDLKHFINKRHRFPLIIKSSISKASKDVYLVENILELEKTMKKILRLYPNQKIVLEEYLDGPQYLVEVLVHNGHTNIVAVFKQEITRDIKFIVTGYEIQLNLEGVLYEKLINTVKSIIKDLGVMNAASHLEVRYVNGVWKLVEINPRISGGAMNRIIEEAYGINLVEETIKLYLGYEPDLKKKHERHIYTHYIIIGSYGYLLKVTGRNTAIKQSGVREVYVKPRKGSMLSPPMSMGNRYGYVIASGDTADEAKANAINAASKIKFYLEPI